MNPYSLHLPSKPLAGPGFEMPTCKETCTNLDSVNEPYTSHPLDLLYKYHEIESQAQARVCNLQFLPIYD